MPEPSPQGSELSKVATFPGSGFPHLCGNDGLLEKLDSDYELLCLV